MFKTLAFSVLLFAGVARADVPPMQPDPMPVPDHPGPIEPDAPETPDNLIVALGTALAAAGAASALVWRRRH